jgi:hypothetical protein
MMSFFDFRKLAAAFYSVAYVLDYSMAPYASWYLTGHFAPHRATTDVNP